jgi:hypothetical protein
MTTENQRLEVCFIALLTARPLNLPAIAAFLTQTVQLDDQTTIRFEIWSVLSPCCSKRPLTLP